MRHRSGSDRIVPAGTCLCLPLASVPSARSTERAEYCRGPILVPSALPLSRCLLPASSHSVLRMSFPNFASACNEPGNEFRISPDCSIGKGSVFHESRYGHRLNLRNPLTTKSTKVHEGKPLSLLLAMR